LYQRSFPTSTVLPLLAADALPWDEGSTIPQPDAQIFAGCLLRYLRPNIEAFPRHSGYLSADPRRRAQFRQRLKNLEPGLKVGLCWCGARQSNASDQRHPPLEAWASLLRTPAIQWIALRRPDPQEISILQEHCPGRWHDWTDTNAKNWDDQAALLSALDRVITVPCTTTHLAGALGVRTLTLLPAWPSGRWPLEGGDTPWYPSMKLYRRQPDRQWEDVLGDLAEDLSQAP
jgi:hypothetical protein